MRVFSSVYFKILLALLFVFLVYQVCFVNPDKDFDIFTAASQLVFDGKSCYEVWLKSGTSGLKYFYSPLFAVLLFPIKQAPQAFNNVVWLLLNLFFLYRLFALLAFFLPLQALSDQKKRWVYGLIVAASARFLLDNLFLGQMTIFLLWGSFESMRLIFEKKYWPGTALLALVMNIKILPITILMYLVYKKEWRAVGLTLLFSVVYLYLPAMVIGFNFNNVLLHDWLTSLTNTTQNSIYEDMGRPGLSSFIPSLLMNTEIQFSIQRNVASLDVNTVKLILTTCRLFLLVLLVFLFGRPFQHIHSKTTLFFDLSLICLVTPLIFPHQGKYALLYSLPAYAWCIFGLINAKENTNSKKGMYYWSLILSGASFMLLTLTTDGLVGRKASDIAEYLHLLTYGALCLLAAMVISRPRNLT